MSKFAWCMDGHHHNCAVTYTWNDAPVVCECECHKKEEAK